ncbi:hypothetical protein GCM10029978_053560 [Actinoallomurus acanthiterrae]
MIVTVTPNPSVDRTLTVERLEHGAVMRAGSSWSEPSGKGVNVALALCGHGYASRAVLPIGGVEGARLETMLRAAGLDYVAVPIDGEIRSNVSVLEPDGTVTKVNEPGPELSDAELKALIDAVVTIGERAEWIVGCGSLPVGAPAGFYAELVGAARRTPARIAVDGSGPPLAAVLAAGPDLIKPNVHELAEAAAGRSRPWATPSPQPMTCGNGARGRSWPVSGRTVRCSSTRTAPCMEKRTSRRPGAPSARATPCWRDSWRPGGRDRRRCGPRSAGRPPPYGSRAPCCEPTTRTAPATSSCTTASRPGADCTTRDGFLLPMTLFA